MDTSEDLACGLGSASIAVGRRSPAAGMLEVRENPAMVVLTP